MNEPKSKQTGLRPTAAVYDTIREMAIEYRFRPDEKINEVVLAKRLGVSRTPVREATLVLEAQGLAERATYVERATLGNERVCPLRDAPEKAPYFSMILIAKGADPWL